MAQQPLSTTLPQPQAGASAAATRASASRKPGEPLPLPPAPPAYGDGGERLFLVEETIQVPRGAATYTLRKGKVLSTKGYDIADLQRRGVALREVTPKVA